MTWLVWTILAMAALTYLSRYILIPLVSRRALGEGLKRYLDLVPASVIASLAAVTLLDKNQALAPDMALGALVTIGVALISRNILVIIVVGIAVVAGFRWLVG